MKIFITGATSKIGRFMVGSLLEKGHDLTLLCRRGAEGIYNGRARIARGDLTDASSYAPALEGIDTVLHLAAVTHTNDIDKYYAINSDATWDLANVCKSSGVKRFVYVSTRAIAEDGGPYSVSKLMGEKHVRESGLDWVIIRPSEVYGIGGKEGMDMFLGKVGSLPFIPVVGNGEYKVAPVHVRDVVSAIVEAVERTNEKCKVYNLAGPENFTYNSFIDRVLELKHLKKSKIHIPVFVFRAVTVISATVLKDRFLVKDQIPRLLSKKSADISLARKDLGFDPARLEDIIGGGNAENG